MTLAAAAVTAHTVRVHRLRNLLLHTLVGTHPERHLVLVGRQVQVQTGIVLLNNRTVACPAGLLGIGIARVSYNTLVGCLPVIIRRITAMTLLAGKHLAVLVLFQKIGVNKKLLVRLQRSHISSSTLSLALYRFYLWLGGLYLPCYLYQLLCTRVTTDTAALLGLNTDWNGQEKKQKNRYKEEKYNNFISV